MVREIEIGKLNPAPYNPRVSLEPGMPEYDKLKRSIETFGDVEPVVWNKRTGNVVGGHQRLRVMRDLGWQQIPCSVVDLDEKDEKLLNLALNKIKGKWDYGKLSDILKDYDKEVATVTGFAEEELQAILANQDELYGDWDDDFSDWDEESEAYTEGSYVVTLIFQTPELAQAWMDDEQNGGKVHPGSSTTVIRIEDYGKEETEEG